MGSNYFRDHYKLTIWEKNSKAQVCENENKQTESRATLRKEKMPVKTKK